ncbi:glycosyltransferase involved in cell wall biosynthesis [Lutibacter sp. Hel_I_33_5]|uniref:glycosyltransferase family 2 protein n=1 Tax=Lutibacter sp. Hel_I_33_5 TaxID=1566289 RepID=UPI0011A5A861|nr:glycosyltransferase family 2 protein [Lutibacter sp. Hel_I_33_5]TVZ55378.1 glycosyltransferase involved in cell wall biosynthesis [Lutibacter sp. Hel_I_33_5]
MTKITAIIPTLNEQIHIEEAIGSVDFADEIIIIDSFSSDKTIELAKKHDVKIIQRQFDDFSSQKNFAIEKASNSWIYILDADERVTEELKNEILKTVKDPKDKVGFHIRRSFFFGAKNLHYGGWQRDKVIRLFLKEYCQYNGNLVHEVIESTGELGFLKNKINHYSYRNYNQYIGKMNHYSELKAQQLFQKNKNVNVYHFLIKPLVRFFIHYVIRLGFLDGYAGLIYARTQAYAVFSRYVKLWHLKNNGF